MPKSQLVDPAKVRAQSVLTFSPIPINQYKADFEAEKKRYGTQGLIDVYADMVAIRWFETMLDSIKLQGGWQGIEYNHKGPAHLSIGQESATVGQALELDAADMIFGSHRSHGEILAKCFSAVRKLDEQSVQTIMEEYLGGDVVAISDKVAHKTIFDRAVSFILFGTLAEIFARKAGFNRGLGGSMHAFFAPFGSMPNNAIVGGSADIATGAALYKRINKRPGIVIANIGDASLATGPVWEAMNMAAMEQYNSLWPKDSGGAPPILFNFMNNFYGMGGQTLGETMGQQILARAGAGINPDNMHAERIDGLNPLAVADAVRRKREVLEKGHGPVLLDTVTYRISGHSPSDASSYRTKEEVELWQKADPLESYAEYLIRNKAASRADLDAIREHYVEKLKAVLALASDDSLCPRVEGSFIESVMYSNTHTQASAGTAQPRSPHQPLHDLSENPRVKSIQAKERYAFDGQGKMFPKNKQFQYRDGLFEALAHHFTADQTMVAWGEENRDWGGAFAVYRGLTELLPYPRLFNSPIAEAAIVGSGIGYALAGGRAVVELMYCDFMGRAGDELFNQASKWQAMSAGKLTMPLVIRVSVGNKYGAQHSQDWSAMVNHIPGLKAYFPATPCDAKGMLNTALSGSDPVVFFESQMLYDIGEQFEKAGVPKGYFETPEGQPALRKPGKDITIATMGATLYRAMDAAKVLQEKYGMNAEIIDLRFICPLNYDMLVESVKKTGKLLLASDSVEKGSFMHNVASTLQTLAFDWLDAPVTVLGSRNWITPAAEMEELYFPQVAHFLDVIHERIVPLDGYAPKSAATTLELARRVRKGV